MMSMMRVRAPLNADEHWPIGSGSKLVLVGTRTESKFGDKTDCALYTLHQRSRFQTEIIDLEQEFIQKLNLNSNPLTELKAYPHQHDISVTDTF